LLSCTVESLVTVFPLIIIRNCKFCVTLFSANVFPSTIRGKTVWGVHSFSLDIRDDFQNSVDLFLPIFLMDCLLL